MTVECFSFVPMMVYGPSKRGMNLATRRLSCDLYSARRFAVESTTHSPILKGNELLRCLFWKCACEILAVSKLSRASNSIGSIFWIIASAVVMTGLSSEAVDTIGGRMRGDLPKRSWNGEYPVDTFSVFMMSKRTFGKAWAQPPWSRSMANCTHCITVLLERSLAPSVSGW